MKLLLLPVLGLLAAAGCADKAHKMDEAPPAVAAAQPVMVASPLLGQWNGPEGTYLLIAGNSGKYALTIRNLDGPRTFEGTGVGDTIVFTRDGKQQTVRASDGAATGMKWLADKKNCVTIDTGEGYCRD
jgi:hypothetical protein